jgi:hypothetical protein
VRAAVATVCAAIVAESVNGVIDAATRATTTIFAIERLMACLAESAVTVRAEEDS